MCGEGCGFLLRFRNRFRMVRSKTFHLLFSRSFLCAHHGGFAMTKLQGCRWFTFPSSQCRKGSRLQRRSWRRCRSLSNRQHRRSAPSWRLERGDLWSDDRPDRPEHHCPISSCHDDGSIERPRICTKHTSSPECLPFLDLLGEFAKLLSLPVTCFHLQLCNLPRLLVGQG